MARLILVWFSILFFYSLNSRAAAKDCECKVEKCHPCEEQLRLDFYTEKCNEGKEVKSCKKPVCKVKTPVSKQCLAQGFKEDGTKGSTKMAYASQIDQPVKKIVESRKEKPVAKKSRSHVGVVIGARGKGWVYNYKGKKLRSKVGLKIYEQDIVETEKKSKIKIMFKDKNILNVTPGSRLKIAKVQFESGSEDQTVLDLMYGTIRSKVKKKYDGANNSFYRVRTMAAVAGVRGTDFVVSFKKGAKIETKVETLHGKVELGLRNGEDDFGDSLNSKDPHDKVMIPKGTYASFVVEEKDVTTDVFTANDIQNFVARGYLTPVYKLTEKELEFLDRETEINVEIRGPASDESQDVTQICSQPGGALNHCLWTCEGNPKGSKKCRTDLPQVSCVRKRCNANGQWADLTRLPASFDEYCAGDKTIVKSCDY